MSTSIIFRQGMGGRKIGISFQMSRLDNVKLLYSLSNKKEANPVTPSVSYMTFCDLIFIPVIISIDFFLI